VIKWKIFYTTLTKMMNTTLFQNFSFIGNNSVCYYVNVSFNTILEMRDVGLEYHDNPTSITLSAFVIMFSIFTLVFGGRLFRPVSAICVGLFGFYAIYQLSEDSSRLSCDVRILISSVIGFVLGMLTGCFIKIALFFIGAFSSAGLVHLIFTVFPELHVRDDVPQILDKSLIYWGVILLSGICGGYILKWKQEISLEVMTALIGGASLAYGLHGLMATLGASVNINIFFVIGISSSILSCIVQRKLRLRRLHEKQTKKTKDVEYGKN